MIEKMNSESGNIPKSEIQIRQVESIGKDLNSNVLNLAKSMGYGINEANFKKGVNLAVTEFTNDVQASNSISNLGKNLKRLLEGSSINVSAYGFDKAQDMDDIMISIGELKLDLRTKVLTSALEEGTEEVKEPNQNLFG